MLESFLLGSALAVAQTPAPGSALPYIPVPTTSALPAYAEPLTHAAPEPEADDAAPTYLFMNLVEGSSVGDFMAKQRLSLGGWVAQSFTASTTDVTNSPVVWNDKANDYLMQQAWLRFERAIDPKSDDITLGFRFDVLYGSDYRFTRSRNIFEQQTGEYGWDPIAFYVNAFLPDVLGGTEVKVGRWFTPFGVESLEAVSTPLVSRSYSFNWAPPFTHTGILATSNVTDKWTVQYGLALGNDIFFGPGTQLRFVGSSAYQLTEDDKVTLGTSLGEGHYDVRNNVNHINVFDLVYNHTFSDRASYAFEGIYGYQDKSLLPRLDVNGNQVQSTAHWFGLANYLFFNFTDDIQSITRVEAFHDAQGFRTGFEGTYYAFTQGLNIKPCPGVIIRPEARYDFNDESLPFEGDRDIFTAAIDLILRW